MPEQEIHPNWYYPIPNMETLILGTFPPHPKRWDFEFFYPNKMNRFWQVLAKIGNVSLKEWSGDAAIAERKQLMKQLRVGVQNIGLVIERKNESALDKDISILEYQDLLGIIDGHDSLQRILLTGYSGKTSTYSSFIEYLKIRNIKHSSPKMVNAGTTFIAQFHRPIICVVGNSTSTAARRVRLEMLVDQFSSAITY